MEQHAIITDGYVQFKSSTDAYQYPKFRGKGHFGELDCLFPLDSFFSQYSAIMQQHPHTEKNRFHLIYTRCIVLLFKLKINVLNIHKNRYSCSELSIETRGATTME